MSVTPKPWRASYTVMTELVFPEHANALGKAFGGQVMRWTDMCGGICAMRHSGGTAVTASVDELHFERPLVVGDIAILQARVTGTFRTSMEVEVTVDGENAVAGTRWRCVDARMTFVAIDEAGKPAPVTPLAAETDEDQAQQEAARRRRTERLARRRGG